MNSCLYECSLWHRRLRPKEHEFLHRVFIFLIDLDEIPYLPREVCRFFPLLTHEKPGVFSFRGRDHLGKEAGGDLRPRLGAWLAGRGVEAPAKVLLLANLRVCGYVFNPLAVYFCYREDGSPLCAVAQVGNTFGEQKLYLVPPDPSQKNAFRLVAAKNFYVSPFSDLDDELDFRFGLPGETLEVAVDDRRGGRAVVRAVLSGERRALTAGRLLWFSVKYPFMTLQVIFLIHWHALLLWAKKIPFRRKEESPEKQTGVLNPLPPK